jgi:hypothetical protein
MIGIEAQPVCPVLSGFPPRFHCDVAVARVIGGARQSERSGETRFQEFLVRGGAAYR